MKIVVLLLVLLLVTSSAIAQEGEMLTVIGHDSFNFSEGIFDDFEADTGVTVEVIRAGDAGIMVNQAILSKGNPLGDVLYGVDNTFLSRALDGDIFIPYESPALENIPESFVVDSEHRVTPVDYGDVCLNYDVAYFEENDLPLPESLADLTNPEYKSLLVVENPAVSSPGLAFLLATIGAFGTEGDYTYLDFWADLVANDVLVVDDWTTAYYTSFSAPGREDGDRPLVVSYASSPPVEVYFMEKLPETALTGAIIADDTCFRQIEFVGILQGTDNLESAQKFVDFMLSREFQEDMPLNMFVHPVNPEAELPEVFTKYSAGVPERPVSIDYTDIETNREEWIQAWTETVLR